MIKLPTGILKSAILMASALFLLALSAHAGNIEIQPGQKNTLEVKENSWQKLRFTHSIADIRTIIVNVDGKAYTRLMINGYSRTNQVGSPELPVRRELIEVPLNAAARVEIINATYRDFDLAALGYPDPVMPAQAPAVKSEDQTPFTISTEAYHVNNFSPDNLVSFETLGIMRSYRIGRLDISPVQYNPVTHTLRVYEEIEATVYFDLADVGATSELKNRYENFYFRYIGKSLLNYQAPASRDTIASYPITYLIISDPMFEAQLQPFIDWKTRQGFRIIEAYTDDPLVGTSTASIKSYIKNLYDNPGAGQQPPSFVLFVGDIQQIPAWTGTSGSHVTDLYYCEYTNDLLPEIYYGRFSAQNTTQLQPQIDKSIQYEQYTMPDPSYLNEVVMIGGMDASHGNDWANGQINYGTINYFNASNGITSHTYLYPESGSHSADIIQDISDGVTFGNYTAHCGYDGWSDPSFNISNIPSLQNVDQYCLLVGNCCLSSKYNESECFAEAILRAQNKGAVAYLGASNNTYWDEDYYFGVGVGTISETPPPYEETTLGMYDRAFHTHGEPWEDWYTTADQHVYAGNLAVTQGAPGSATYYWEIYNIMGDPSLMVYYSEPIALTVSYEPLMPLNTTSFTVETEPFAYVGISVDNVLKGAALADAEGIAVVPLTPVSIPGIADVVVTKQNRQPYIGTVIVANPEGPFILLDGFETFELSGYTNDKIEPGEVTGFDIELRNYGLTDGTDVVAMLSTTDEYVTISDNYEFCGTVPASSIETYKSTFSIIIDENIPDGHEVEFVVNIQDASRESWSSEMTILLAAPILKLNSLVINDNAGGNGNGRLDPGESAEMIATFSNAGHSIARNALVNLCVHSGFVNIADPDHTIDNLGFFGVTPVTFQVDVDNNAPNGILADFVVNLTSGKYELLETHPRKIGFICENFETGNFFSFPWIQEGNAPWTVINTYPYEGYYCMRSGAIANSQTSEIKINYYVMQADSISFYKKVSSEPGDFLKFMIDGQTMEEWSGTTGGWKRVSYFVSPGNHTFKWIFAKNASGSAGADAAWIDYIVFPPALATTIYAGDDAVICDPGVLSCGGQATYFAAACWATSGTGTFSDTGILDPVYTPSNDDVSGGSVTLSLSIEDFDGEAFSDDLVLSFINIPAKASTPAGPDGVNIDFTYVSEYITEPLNDAVDYQWVITPEEAGIFTGQDTAGTVVWNRNFAGTANISVIGFNDCGEGISSELLTVTVENSAVNVPEIKAGLFNFQVYPNPVTKLLHVNFTGEFSGKLNISLVNLVGIEVVPCKSYNSANMVDIPVDQLSPGLYLLIVTSGDQQVARKIIVR